VVIHRAILGSTERFLGILIEHYGGAFPLWLSPVQIAILPVADRHVDFAGSLAQDLRSHGLRVTIDDSTESVGKKIRRAEKSKVPVMLVVGDKEAGIGATRASHALTVRRRGVAEQQEIQTQEFILQILDEIRTKR